MINHTLRIEPSGLTLTVEHGICLADILKSFKVEFPCGGKGVCGNCKVKILSGTVRKDILHESILNKKNLSSEWCLACYTKVEDDLVIEIPDGNMSVQSDMSDVDIKMSESGTAVAVDLGSTTVVSQLVDLTSGKVLASCSGINPQSSYGADIISRISYAMESGENLSLLSNLIRSSVGFQIKELLAQCPDAKVKKVRIVGNTVMHNLFSGFDVTGLSRAPYQSEHNELCRFTPDSLGWNFLEDCIIEFMPNIGHFVGSDILGGIISCGMMESEKYSLLVDLGTNGEIALGNKNGFIFTSTAAGPAFEGINISCGMRASSGAISEVGYEDGKFKVSVIDGISPKGLCGSGLVEAVHCLLKNGMIDFSGAVTEAGKEKFELSEGVYLTVADIREFQLAKAAIATGIQLLLNHSSLTYNDISAVYVTGGLGNYLNTEKIRQLGIIPDISEDKYIRMSNAALSGCKILLYEDSFRKLQSILDKSRYCPLETDASFMDVYCNNMFFPYDWI